MTEVEPTPERRAAWQAQMDAVFDQYFSMSEILQADVNALLDGDMTSPSGRRNFIRGACALVEGYTACFRDLCQLGLELHVVPLSGDERRVLKKEQEFALPERTRLSLIVVYKMYFLPKLPKFSHPDWENAKKFLSRRNKLMHPKSVSDLEFEEQEWRELYDGVLWLFQQLFGFMEQVHAREATKAQEVKGSSRV